MSWSHWVWSLGELVERPRSLQLRALNSGSRAARAPSSVVHMGVKGAGWEKNRHQELAA